MYQGILQVEENPFATIFAFDTDWPVPCFACLFGNVFDQCLNVATGRAARNNHVVRHGRQIPDIEPDDILCLDIIQRVDGKLAELFAVHERVIRLRALLCLFALFSIAVSFAGSTGFVLVVQFRW
jgi:hypothetical protein